MDEDKRDGSVIYTTPVKSFFPTRSPVDSNADVVRRIQEALSVGPERRNRQAVLLEGSGGRHPVRDDAVSRAVEFPRLDSRRRPLDILRLASPSFDPGPIV